jgi:hypothetical protein
MYGPLEILTDFQLMDSRPDEVTEHDPDKGMDVQGIVWGIGNIPAKEDFRESR